jgi:Holliday junction resolvasome RuvABC ATP-dependent DNA helicase subunit
MNATIGTIVTVSQDTDGYLIATAPNGDVIVDVPSHAMKTAFTKYTALKLIATKTGGTQWRQIPLADALTVTVTETAHPLDTDQVDVSAEEKPMTHLEIIEFLDGAHKLKPNLLKITPLHWKFALRAVLRGENLLIRGESGCGKTLLATTLQKVLNRPFFYLNMGATQDPRSTLIGNTHFKKDEGTYVAESYFVQAIKTPNAVILLDEVSRAHPDAHNILMTVLDKTQRYLRIDERPDTPTVRVAPGVTFIGTANVGSEYTATRTMDRAFIDRWTVLMMNPLSRDEEVDLLSGMFPSLDGHLVTAIAEIAAETRTQVKSETPRVDTIISTRITTEMAALCYDGFALSEVCEVCVYPFYTDAGGPQSPQTFMRTFIQQFIKDEATAKKKNPFANGDPNGGAVAPWVKKK